MVNGQASIVNRQSSMVNYQSNYQPLPVMEHFYTLQGEGYHQGRAAYFIRLGGCDVGCVWCDVKDSWDAGVHPKKSVREIMSWVVQNTPPLQQGRKAGLVVITGGEPLMHDLTGLTAAL